MNSMIPEGKIRNNIAAKLNPVFYQLLSESYDEWYYERFINIVSYDRQDQHIIDFMDNNTNVYESCVQTIHIFSVNELDYDQFNSFIIHSILKKHFVNIWCDEYYIKDSIYYNKKHYVHPLTIYGINKCRVCCEFFSINRGMILIEIPLDDLRLAFYSINEFYAHGASSQILKTAISTYEVKKPSPESFDLAIFTDELNNYWHGQPCGYKMRECHIDGKNITYGITYYNNLLDLIKNPQRYSYFPYKCLFDLHLHKLFLVERLKYVREMFGFDETFDVLISRIEEVAKIYERMNMLNMKYNMRDRNPPYTMSPNPEFKSKFSALLQQSFEVEIKTIPQIIDYLNNAISNQYNNQTDDFIIEYSGDEMILYPRFDEYIQQFSIRMDSRINNLLPVKLQLSNGYVFYSDSSGAICTYSFRPTKLSWIKISNCTSLEMIHVRRLSDEAANTLNNFSLTQWRPLNHIDHWEVNHDIATFDIGGLDPYMICEGINIDAKKSPYITITYATDDISNKAQLYFMTDESPIYSSDKSFTFDIVNSNEKFAYKLDLSDNQTWNNIITLLRLDPVHYPAQYEKDHISSHCSIYDFSVSSVPFVYSSESDYADGQRINQWEYCYHENGAEKYLEYDKNENVWKADNGSCIGVDFQNAVHEIMVSRNWKCPSAGIFQINFSGESDAEDSVAVILDNNEILYDNTSNRTIRYMDNVRLEKGTMLRFISNSACLKNISIKIQKLLPN